MEIHGPHVRHILFWSDENAQRLETCLSWCPNVVDIALWNPVTDYTTSLIQLLLSLRITHLSFDISTFDFGVQNFGPSEAAFRFVTHLDLIGPRIFLKAKKIKTYFPSVTHIAFNEDERLSVADVLDCWKDQLEVLILTRRPKSFPSPNDPRITVLRQHREFMKEWIAVAEDQSSSMWRLGKVAVERQRCGLEDA